MTHIKSTKGRQTFIKRNVSALGKSATYKVYRMIEKSKGMK